MKEPYSDEELVKMIQSGRQLLISRATTFLYNIHFEAISKWLQPLPHGIKAIDIFAPKLTDLVLDIMIGKTIITKQATIKTNLYTYCGNGRKNEWRSHNRRNNLEDNLPPPEDEEAEKKKKAKKKKRKAMFAYFYSKLRQKCQNMIRMVIYEGKSHEEIAVIMGFKSEQQSRNLLSNCKKKLRKMILDNVDWEDEIEDDKKQ